MASIGEELERLVKLRDAGDLTAQEFETLKSIVKPPDSGVEDDPEVAALQEELAAKETALQEVVAAKEREILERIEKRRRAEEELQRKEAVAKRVADLKAQLSEVDSELTSKGISVPKEALRPSAPKVMSQACTQCNFADVRMPCDHCPQCRSKMSDQKGAVQSWRCGACNLITGRYARRCKFCDASFDVEPPDPRSFGGTPG